MKAVADNIKSESRTADKIFIWTDCDREGEHIGWEVTEIARSGNRRLQMSDVKRAMFNNVDPGHLRQAAMRPVDLDMRQVQAVQARIEIDLRTGAAFTRFQTTLLQSALRELDGVISYGSCQFPTLGFVVDRYKRVKNFVPEPFWYMHLETRRPSDERPTSWSWDRGRLYDRLAATVLYDRALAGSSEAVVQSVVRKPTTKWRPLPLTTVELQKQGARFLKMSSKKIMDIAEALYTSGYISYPRTETDQFNEKIDLRALIDKQKDDNNWGQYARELLTTKFRTPRKGKHDDKAHPPIHPVIGANRTALRPDQLQVYDFVTRHFLACCSDDAKGESTTVVCDFNGEKFTTSGLIVKERNFLDVYPYWTWNSSQIADFTTGEHLPVSECTLQDGKTTAPGYLTEPELIALMDANGIGTDATMADHIEKIVVRNYVMKHGQNGRKSLPVLIPSTLGIALVEGYDEIGFDKSLTKPFLRKDMEAAMKRICDGNTVQEEVVRTSLAMYREVFALARTNRAVLVSAVQRYVNSNTVQQQQQQQQQPVRPTGASRARTTASTEIAA